VHPLVKWIGRARSNVIRDVACHLQGFDEPGLIGIE